MAYLLRLVLLAVFIMKKMAASNNFVWQSIIMFLRIETKALITISTQLVSPILFLFKTITSVRRVKFPHLINEARDFFKENVFLLSCRVLGFNLS